MRKGCLYILTFIFISAFGFQSAAAQFPLKIPKLGKPKSEPTKPSDRPNESPGTDAPGNTNDTVGYMERPRPTAVPVLLKNTLKIDVHTRNTYWKTPADQYHSSWIPLISFDVFLDSDEEVNYTAEWLNPNGSLWYSEVLDGTKNRASSELLDTKASSAAGTYGVRLLNTKTKEVAFEGTFKVGKIFMDPKSPRYKNQAMFYVDNDWSLPIGYVGFDQNSGWDRDPEPVVSFWLKGDLSADDLEARLFYAGEQLMTTKTNGLVENNSEQKRNWDSCFQQTDICRYQLWDFTFRNFKVASFDRSRTKATYVRDANAIYTKDKPGEYTVKVYYKGEQVRETKFNIQPNGYLQANPYSKEMPINLLRSPIPVKVIGTLEKWNKTTWKQMHFTEIR